MTEKIHDFNASSVKPEDTKEVNSKAVYVETQQENLTVFACLIDMIALEEGVFGSGTSTSRIARAHRNLQHGLLLKDGSIFRYTHSRGPSLDDIDGLNGSDNKEDGREEKDPGINT